MAEIMKPEGEKKKRVEKRKNIKVEISNLGGCMHNPY